MTGKIIGNIGKIKIALVDGTKIRNEKAVNFVFAGHDKAYAFIPKNQIWIEKAVPAKERKFIIMHEFDERNMMSHGIGYSKAHEVANKLENFHRKMEKVI
jgi:hypothetical protein